MRFEEAYEGWNQGRLEGWNQGRLTQAEGAQILGMCERSFRRYLVKHEAEGLEGLIDRRLEQVSNRRAPVDEVMAIKLNHYRQSGYSEWPKALASSAISVPVKIASHEESNINSARGMGSGFLSARERGRVQAWRRGSVVELNPDVRSQRPSSVIMASSCSSIQLQSIYLDKNSQLLAELFVQAGLEVYICQLGGNYRVSPEFCVAASGNSFSDTCRGV